MILYVYIVSFVLNIISIYRKVKGRVYDLLFLILKNILMVALLNILFSYGGSLFHVNFIELEVFLVLFLFTGVSYILKKRYGCISFGGSLAYLFLYALNSSLRFREIIFIIGMLHVCEGIFICLSFRSDDSKLYLPLCLGGTPLVFVIFYRRDRRFCLKREKFISGLFVFLYGIIVIIIYKYMNNVLSLVLICFLHEFIIVIERIIIRMKFNDIFRRMKYGKV